EAGDLLRLALVRLPVLRRDEERAVGRIEGKVREEGLAPVGAAFHPRLRLAEEDVRAVPLVSLPLAVVAVVIVEVVVLPIVGGRGDVRRGEVDGFLKAAIVRPIRIILPEV